MYSDEWYSCEYERVTAAEIEKRLNLDMPVRFTEKAQLIFQTLEYAAENGQEVKTDGKHRIIGKTSDYYVADTVLSDDSMNKAANDILFGEALESVMEDLNTLEEYGIEQPE
jgi:hypothetical protein